MSELKFTPGPWAATRDRVFSAYGQSSGDGHVLQDSEKWMIADLIGSGSYGGSEFIELGDDDRQYNAKLIAAAPELLEGCRAAEQCIVDFLEIYKSGGSRLVLDEAVKSLQVDALKASRAAILKATA